MLEAIRAWRWRRDFVEEVADLMDESHRVDVEESLVARTRTITGELLWKALRREGWDPTIAAHFVVLTPRFTELRLFWRASTQAVVLPDRATGLREIDQAMRPSEQPEMWQRGGKVYWRGENGFLHCAPAEEFTDLSGIPERP
jgi:hypothetical protein